jgi:hypothetical protein
MHRPAKPEHVSSNLTLCSNYNEVYMIPGPGSVGDPTPNYGKGAK